MLRLRYTVEWAVSSESVWSTVLVKCFAHLCYAFFAIPPAGGGLTLIMVQYENINFRHASIATRVTQKPLQIIITKKSVSCWTPLYTAHQFQSLPIGSSEPRKKIPFKCAKLLTKTVVNIVCVNIRNWSDSKSGFTWTKSLNPDLRQSQKCLLGITTRIHNNSLLIVLDVWILWC